MPHVFSPVTMRVRTKAGCFYDAPFILGNMFSENAGCLHGHPALTFAQTDDGFQACKQADH
ncbi:hypothetical protein COO20_13655 [Thalassospira marina]|uniref:Uncharacterized protein n=1 Tax=Thalassospira marina TaxID=2048283 RepID=A0A2N3KSN9_9PROT|nr:hypothetical protein COO20_13655 [Thalassospira marina]